MSIFRSVVNRASEAVQNVVDTATNIAEGVENFATNLGEKTVDTFNLDELSLDGVGEALWDGAKDLFTGKGSLGGMVDGAMDALGLPDWAGDFIGAGVDFMTMNPRGYEHLLDGLGGLAGEAGMEGLESFLDRASDVTGMAIGVGQQVAMSMATGGAGAAGIAAQLGNAGQLGQAGQWIAKGVEVAGHLDDAMGAVQSFKDGDILGAGTALFGILGGTTGGLGEVFGGLTDSGVGEVLQSVFGDGGDLLGTVLEQFGGDMLSELPLGDILGQLGLDGGDLDGLAGPIVGIGKELVAQLGSGIDFPGAELFASNAGQELINTLGEILTTGGAEALDEVGLNAQMLLNLAAQTTGAMFDVAYNDSEVAAELIELMLQTRSMSGASQVSDLLGAQIQC